MATNMSTTPLKLPDESKQRACDLMEGVATDGSEGERRIDARRQDPVAFAAIGKLKLTLNHQVRCWLVERVKLLFISILRIKKNLAVIAARCGRYSFCFKFHVGGLGALTLALSGTQHTPRSCNPLPRVRDEQPFGRGGISRMPDELRTHRERCLKHLKVSKMRGSNGW